MSLKGGTAIRKLWAGNAGRLSADLDFAGLDEQARDNEYACGVMTRLDPIIALTGSQRALLAEADARDPDGVLRVSGQLTLDQLSGADTFVNARTLLAALDEAPVRATKERGNFELPVVARMLGELRFDAEKQQWLRHVSRRPTEDDVPGLHTLRVVLGLAGLLKKRSGHFSVTQRGRRLLSPDRAADLYELLLRTYFGRFNIFYPCGHREDPHLQRHIVLALWTVRRVAEHQVPTARIAALMPRNDALWSAQYGPGERYPGEYEGAVTSVLLKPLRGFGLLDGGVRTGSLLSGTREPWRATPLFDAAISFDLGDGGAAAKDASDGAAGSVAAVPGGRGHLRLVSNRPEGGPVAGPGSSVPSVARLRITLRHVEPAVWRRLEVPADSTFETLHRYLNTAMGWLDYHLHDFNIGQRRIAAGDADWESEWPCEDESGVVLGDVLAEGARAFVYRYDFGDDWEHLVEVEHVGPAEPHMFTPRCIEAVGACPPEDCGGVPGYLGLLEALADPEHPDRADLLEWLGGPFDPARVDIDGINRLLHLAATGELRQDDLDYFSEE
jgi:hypothetical protein